MPEDASPYIKKLIELGFKKIQLRQLSARPGQVQAYTIEAAEPTEAPLPSHQKTAVLLPGEPCFMTAGSSPGSNPRFAMTIAWDETEQAWRKDGEVIDLSPFGFKGMLDTTVFN